MMTAEISTCVGCGHRRPVHADTGRCLACRDRAGDLEGPGRVVAADGGDMER